MRVDTDHVIQLICEHSYRPPAQRWGTHPVSVWGGNRGRQNCDGSRAHNADRLLIRPASGRQTGAGHSARTYHWKDTHTTGSFGNRVTSEEHGTTLATTPDGVPRTLTVRE